MFSARDIHIDLPISVLDVIPNPILVKDSNLRYVWINSAFEDLFGIKQRDVFGRLDTEIFPNRQTSQCNCGDMRVLETGEIDEAHETIVVDDEDIRETLTRKSRMEMKDGNVFLVGVMHDLTDILSANAALTKSKRSLEAQAEQLIQLANTDALTGAMSRYGLNEHVAKFDQSGARFGLLVLDIDHFKSINDTYGHAAGDAALIHLCNVLRMNLQDEECLARIGGEEFVVFLPHRSAQETADLGAHLLKVIEQSNPMFNDIEIPMTASIGGVYIHNDSERRERPAMCRLAYGLRVADEALYCAKNGGRNTMCFA